jgi:lysyl-tRNA synthetase class 2
MENLKRRAELLKRLRLFFDDRDFFEVETPLLSSDVVVDRHIEPVAVERLRTGIPGAAESYWLQTSPEFSMKRLLAEGAERIYQICKAFRNSERGPHHNPEFTMLEWYRVGDSYDQGRELLADFATFIFDCNQVDQVSYQKAFRDHLSLCPFASSTAELLSLAREKTSVEFCDDDSKDEVLNALLSECIEPVLGDSQPVILFDFPASQSALAKVREEEFPVAERFELYFQGVELANGYHELCDADELVQRNQQVNLQRAADGKQSLPVESRLLEAMRKGLPGCCGVAVGVDRLLMLLLEVEEIAEVVAFPIELA